MQGRCFKITMIFLVFSTFAVSGCRSLEPKKTGNIFQETGGKKNGTKENPELWTGRVPEGFYLVPKKVHLYPLHGATYGFRDHCDLILQVSFHGPEHDYDHYYCNLLVKEMGADEAMEVARKISEYPFFLLENRGPVKEINRHYMSCFHIRGSDCLSLMDVPKGTEKARPEFIFQGTLEEIEELKRYLESQGMTVRER